MPANDLSATRPPTIRRLRTSDEGFALVIATVFIGLILFYGVIVLNSSFSTRRAGKIFKDSLVSEQIAEAGLHKAIFCLRANTGTNCSGTYGASYVGESNMSYGGGKFTVTITGSGSNRVITATGTASSGKISTLKLDVTTLPVTDDTSFGYALQSGQGGAYLSNGSEINGTIYSNGDVVCQSTGAEISGDAYSTKSGGKIASCDIGANAHADKILDDLVHGNAYYKNNPADVAGSTVTGTKYPNSATPTVVAMPPVDLDFWHRSAEYGGTHDGNYTAAGTVSLGPLVINGDLIMDNNAVVTILGPLWVKGDILTGNNSTFQLNPAFGPYGTVILADDPNHLSTKGKINIYQNTIINGSGYSTSHILFISSNSSTNDAAPAMTVSNNAAGAVFMTLSGTLKLAQNARAKSLAGYRLFLDQNAVVTYTTSEFASYFSNSPSSNWRQIDKTWRQVR